MQEQSSGFSEKETHLDREVSSDILSAELLGKLEAALSDGDLEACRSLAHAAPGATLARVFELLSRDSRQRLLRVLGHRLDAEVLGYLDEALREEALQARSTEALVRDLPQLDSDDALEILEDLDERRREAVLSNLPGDFGDILRQGFSFAADSAGRLMQREIVVVPRSWCVGETIDYLRAAPSLPEDFYDIFLIDDRQQPVGVIPLSRILRSGRGMDLHKLARSKAPQSVPAEMDREDVALLFRRYGLTSAPVVDSGNRIIGAITVDDVMDVMEAEAKEDLMGLGGIFSDDFYRNVFATARARSGWLAVNMITAVLASIMVALFAKTIEQMVALAILMPMVASMGGNVGSQSLTITVQALSRRALPGRAALRFLGKETIAAILNGILFSAIGCLAVWLWFGRIDLGMVVGVALGLNFMVAGSVGTLVPLLLRKVGADPAIASGVFVSAVTDMVGFLLFLGLASIFLL